MRFSGSPKYTVCLSVCQACFFAPVAGARTGLDARNRQVCSRLQRASPRSPIRTGFGERAELGEPRDLRYDCPACRTGTLET